MGLVVADAPGPLLEQYSSTWAYSVGAGGVPRGVYREITRGNREGWRWVGPLPYVREVVIRRDGAGGVMSRSYRIAARRDSARAVLWDAAELHKPAWQQDVGLPAVRDSRTLTVIAEALDRLAMDAAVTEAVPGWTPEGLAMPAGDVGPRGYGDTVGSEADAITAWQQIAGLLGEPGNERGALFAGFALAGPLVGLFERQAFIAHACGRSSGGKSTLMRVASAMFGPPLHVMGTWNLSPVAVSEDLIRLGTLPAFRDEIGMIGTKTPREVESLIFQTAEGGARSRARRQGGGTTSSARWRSVLLSTGNDSLLGMATKQEGMAVRVVELEAPLTADRSTAERLDALANGAAGWPLEWMRRTVTAQQGWEALAAAERDLGADVLGGPPGRIGRSIATGVAGAALLEQITGTTGARAAALTAALEVYGAAVAEMTETAQPDGDRLLSAIVEAMAADRSAFPDRNEYIKRCRDDSDLMPPARVMGVTYEEDGELRVAVLRGKLDGLCTAAGIVSPRTGLRDLRKDGRLLAESYASRPSGLTRREWFGTEIGQVVCYTFRQLPSDPLAPPAIGPSAAIADLPLPPMPALLPALAGFDPTAPIGGPTVLVDLDLIGDPAPLSPADLVDGAPPAPATAPLTAALSVPSSERPQVPEQSRPPVPEQPPAAPAHSPTRPASRPVRRAAKRPAPAGSMTAWAIRGGEMLDPATGQLFLMPSEATTDLHVLVTGACRACDSADVTLVLDADMHTGYGLPATRPALGRSPWTKTGAPAKGSAAPAFMSLVDAGWHAPAKPDERPRIMPVTALEHPDYPGRRVRIMPAAWLTEHDFPRAASDPQEATADTLARRLLRMRELTGWTWASTAGATSLDGLRRLIETTARRQPRWSASTDKWPTPALCTAWERPHTDDEPTEVIGYDAVKNYLSAYGSAVVAPDELTITHDVDPTARDWAGFALITVPTWPHPLVPAPVADQPPGAGVWVTAAVVQLYAELGIEVAITQAWTAPRVDLAGMREFQKIIRGALDGLETGGPAADNGRPFNTDDAALWEGLKALYRTCHGKLRDTQQRRVARPDWGHAVRDQAWVNLLRKVYRAAGILALTGGQWATAPRFPVRVDVDELVYPAIDDQPPAGIVLGRGLGQFRVKRHG